MHLGSAKTTATYLIIIGISVITFVATNSAVSLWVVLFMLAIAIASIVHTSMVVKLAKVKFAIERSHDVENPLNLVIELKVPTLFLPTRIEVDAAFINQLFGIETSNTLVLRSTGARQQTFVYPYPEFACGKVDVHINRLSFFDVFGIVRADQKPDFRASRLVYPRCVSMKIVFDRSPQAAYSGTTFDNFKRGSDKSEVLDLRPYADGDDPRNVHWKLSAKVGELLVRESSRPTDYNICLLLGVGRKSTKPIATVGEMAAGAPATGTPAAGAPAAGAPVTGASAGASFPIKTLDRALALFGSVSLEMVHGGVGHEVVIVDGNRLRFLTVDSQSTWGSMLDASLSLPIPETSQQSIDLFALDPVCSHFTKVIYVTTEIDEKLLHRLSERCDVTAFLVGDVSTSQHESIEHCDIVSLASSQLEGVVETLSV